MIVVNRAPYRTSANSRASSKTPSLPSDGGRPKLSSRSPGSISVDGNRSLPHAGFSVAVFRGAQQQTVPARLVRRDRGTQRERGADRAFEQAKPSDALQSMHVECAGEPRT